MNAATSAQGRKSDNPLARAIQAEHEGIVFFEKAQSIATNPRVKEVLGKLVRTKREHLRSFEESLREARIAVPAEEARRAKVYPIDELQRKECYVCGYTTELEAVPESCPRCGASRYAFEKDITMRKAWEFAESGMRATLKILDEVSKEADEAMKKVLSRQSKIEQSLLGEMRKEFEGSGER